MTKSGFGHLWGASRPLRLAVGQGISRLETGKHLTIIIIERPASSMRHRISRSHTPRVQDFSHRRLLVLEKRDVGEAGYLDKSQVRELELGYDGEGEKGQRHEWVVQPRSHGPCQGLQQPSFYAPPQRSADLEPGDRSGRIAISPPASPPPSLRRLCAAGHPTPRIISASWVPDGHALCESCAPSCNRASFWPGTLDNPDRRGLSGT